MTQLSVVSEQLSVKSYQLSVTECWSLITMFAALHHIPSNEIRLDILRTVKKMLKPGGRFILSNWQFLNSEKLKVKFQPWSRVGLSDLDVDEGDYLLDWRGGGGEGLRDGAITLAEELLRLADQVRMKVEAGFLSDGENGRLWVVSDLDAGIAHLTTTTRLRPEFFAW